MSNYGTRTEGSGAKLERLERDAARFKCALARVKQVLSSTLPYSSLTIKEQVALIEEIDEVIL